MARIAGVQIIRAANGTIKKVIFDYKKHEAILKPILVNLGAIEDDFEKEWHEGGYSVAQSRKKMHTFISKLPLKK